MASEHPKITKKVLLGRGNI